MRFPVPLFAIIAALVCVSCHPAPTSTPMPKQPPVYVEETKPQHPVEQKQQHRRRAIQQLQKDLNEAKRSLELSAPKTEHDP